MIPYRLASEMVKDGWHIRNIVAWHKPNAMPYSGTDRLASTWEPVIVASKTKRYKWNLMYRPPDVWTIPLQPWGRHPAIFPPLLPLRCLAHGTDEGDLVLDPFAGSGTTLAVAGLGGRDYLGFEASEAYADRFVERWAWIAQRWEALKAEVG